MKVFTLVKIAVLVLIGYIVYGVVTEAHQNITKATSGVEQLMKNHSSQIDEILKEGER